MFVRYVLERIEVKQPRRPLAPVVIVIVAVADVDFVVVRDDAYLHSLAHRQVLVHARSHKPRHTIY